MIIFAVRKNISLVFCCLLCLLVSSCASTQIKNIKLNGEFELYDDEARLWKRSQEFQEILNKRGYIYQDDNLAQYVNNVLHKLIGEFEKSNNVELKVYIIEDPLFNAFCLPDGAIYIHTSILASADNEAQLATVLAHEASHFLYRHSLRQQRSLTNKSAFLTIFDMTLGSAAYALGGVLGSSANLARLLGDYAVIGSFYGYSRKIEREADENAFELVKNAGYNPIEAKAFLENLYEATKDKKKIPYFYSTHPRTKKRIKTFEKLIRNLSQKNNGEIKGADNSDIYNKMVKNVFLDNAELDMKREKGLKSARRQIERYNRLYPDSARAHYLLGKLAVLTDKKEEAKEAFTKSIKLNPNYSESYRELGLLYYKSGEKQNAKTEFEKYLQLKPGAEDAEYIRGYLNE